MAKHADSRRPRSRPSRAGLPTLVVLVPALAAGCSFFGYPGGAPAPVGGGAGPPDDAPTMGESYQVAGRTYHVLRSGEGYRRTGVASWYGPEFHGRATSNGETFDQDAMTAAHRSLPFGTRVRVTHLETGRSVVVRINDRGPFVQTGERIIDLSREAARRLGILGEGTAPVELVTLEPGA